MNTCHGCGGIIGRDCFNPQECEQITRQMAEAYLNMLQPEPHFTDLPKEEQARINDEDLREMKDWFGSWDDLRKRIDELEQGDFEQAFESRYTPQ